MSLPTRECGLKWWSWNWKRTWQRHSLRGSVDWNSLNRSERLAGSCHSLRGSVDWNWSGTNKNSRRKLSLPTRECGLKLLCLLTGKFVLCHSLRGSVDWNPAVDGCRTTKTSLPTRECGLKLRKIFPFISKIMSLPTRECGLKFTSFYHKINSHCHSLRGSVDWNRRIRQHNNNCWVTPYAGVWIEIFWFVRKSNVYTVTPYAGVWIEMGDGDTTNTVNSGHSLRGSVDWNGDD